MGRKPKNDYLLVAAPGKRLWDRMRDEPPAAYELFRTYRDLSAKSGRSLESLARVIFDRLDDSEPIDIPREYSVYRRRHYWETRCLAWDNYIHRERDRVAADFAKQWERSRLRHLREALELGDMMGKKAKAMLATEIYRTQEEKNGKTIIHEPGKWNFGTARDLAMASIELKSAAITAALPNVADATDSELEAIRDAHLEDAAEQAQAGESNGGESGTGEE